MLAASPVNKSVAIEFFLTRRVIARDPAALDQASVAFPKAPSSQPCLYRCRARIEKATRNSIPGFIRAFPGAGARAAGCAAWGWRCGKKQPAHSFVRSATWGFFEVVLEIPAKIGSTKNKAGHYTQHGCRRFPLPGVRLSIFRARKGRADVPYPFTAVSLPLFAKGAAMESRPGRSGFPLAGLLHGLDSIFEKT